MDQSNEPVAQGPDPAEVYDIKPTLIGETSTSKEEVLGNIDVNAQKTGHGLAIVKPEAEDSDNLADTLRETDKRFELENIPKPKEVIYFRDRIAFAPEAEEHPQAEPFVVYNTTNQPIDIRFFRYTLASSRYWLSDRSQEGVLNIDGHTIADVRPKAEPHIFIMAEEMPRFLRNNIPQAEGISIQWPNLTAGFIQQISEKDGQSLPFSYDSIATEICNGLIDVGSATVIPGEKADQGTVQKALS
ncbi:MAG TPA: hypothetical protein VD947_02835, partial [Patescibacteria group bacterium]|nr:hypothetical protein [Patescibacteria group bacterium]